MRSLNALFPNDCRNLSPIRIIGGCFIAVFVLISVMIPSCIGSRFDASSRWHEISKNGYTVNPVVVGVFHGDTSLNNYYRQAVEKGFEDINRTSCGMVKLSIVWDLNVQDIVRDAFEGKNVLIIVDSVDLNINKNPDYKDLIGLTRNNGSWWIFLVQDRLGAYTKYWEWVTAHELGHAIGMEHVQDGLMMPYAPPFIQEDDIVGWDKEDMQEFCRMYSCDPNMFKSCRYR